MSYSVERFRALPLDRVHYHLTPLISLHVQFTPRLYHPTFISPHNISHHIISPYILMIALAISKCYGKVWALFFPGDNSLVSRGKSPSSRVPGLVVRCLLFNPEVSCSTPCVCANFFTSIPKRRFSIFWHYETPPFFRLCETFLRKFFQMSPKYPPFNLLGILKQSEC